MVTVNVSRVPLQLQTSVGLCCSVHGHAHSSSDLQGTADGSCVWPQCCILWVQPMARVAAVCAAFFGHLCSLVLCPENPKATQTVKRGSCVSMGSLFCIVAGPHLTVVEHLE